jgi:hypothetical protein
MQDGLPVTAKTTPSVKLSTKPPSIVHSLTATNAISVSSKCAALAAAVAAAQGLALSPKPPGTVNVVSPEAPGLVHTSPLQHLSPPQQLQLQQQQRLRMPPLVATQGPALQPEVVRPGFSVALNNLRSCELCEAAHLAEFFCIDCRQVIRTGICL